MSSYRGLFVLSLFLMLVVLAPGCTTGSPGQPVADNTTAVVATAQVAEEETNAARAAQDTLETAVALTVSAQTEATAAVAAEQTGAAATANAATAEAATAEAATAVALAEAATATWMTQATETAVALATKRAEMVAEVTAVFITKQEELIQEAQSRQPIYGPTNADLSHVEDELMETHFADVNVRNFVAEATFILDPSAGQIGNRDFGFLFRIQDKDAWCLSVKRSGEWELLRYDADSNALEVTGRMASDIAGESNTLTLYVNESAGAFFVNGQFISSLPLTNGPEMGNIAAVIGVFHNSEKDGEITRVKDITIWPVGEAPPTATPPVSTAAPRATAPPPGFDATALINSLNTLRLTIEHMGGLLDRLYHGEAQSCGEFLGYYQALQQRTPYSNLPTAWQGIYSEYNFAAENILNTNTSIKTLCESGGGYMSDLDYGVARQGIGLSLDRINQAIQAANNLLNQ